MSYPRHLILQTTEKFPLQWSYFSQSRALERASALVELRHFLAPLGAENPSEQGKEVNNLKMPETLVNTRFMPIRAKRLSLSRFEAIFDSVFV